jgi:hypothetical protein
LPGRRGSFRIGAALVEEAELFNGELKEAQGVGWFDGSAQAGPEGTRGTERDVTPAAKGGLWARAERSPARTKFEDGSCKKNRARSFPWRKPPSKTKNKAILGEATSSRKTLELTSLTASFSDEEPTQYCSTLQKDARGTGRWSSQLTAMYTGEGAKSGEPGATGVQT